jgi:hypothetical protein
MRQLVTIKVECDARDVPANACDLTDLFYGIDDGAVDAHIISIEVANTKGGDDGNESNG